MVSRKGTPEEAKITNTLLSVVALFMICWAPFAITMFFLCVPPQAAAARGRHYIAAAWLSIQYV